MPTPNPPDIRQTVTLAATGDTTAAEELLRLVYAELRELARARLARTPPGQTLEATALVHEAYMRLVGEGGADFEGRRHFFFAAARAMRDIIVERARARVALKRGGGGARVPLDEAGFEVEGDPGDLVALEGALERLETVDPEAARIVMLRFFVGLSHERIGDVMGVSVSTVERRWRVARAWLANDIDPGRTG